MEKKDLILNPQHASQPALAGVSGPFCKTDKPDMVLESVNQEFFLNSLERNQSAGAELKPLD